MSKIGRDRIIMLQESAEELGFRTIQQALDAGYHEVQDLVNNTFKLEKVEDLTNKAYREAREEREDERRRVLADLRELLNDYLPTGEQDEIEALERAIDYIEGEEIK